jgi:hypothetical protein
MALAENGAHRRGAENIGEVTAAEHRCGLETQHGRVAMAPLALRVWGAA